MLGDNYEKVTLYFHISKLFDDFSLIIYTPNRVMNGPSWNSTLTHIAVLNLYGKSAAKAEYAHICCLCDVIVDFNFQVSKIIFIFR